MSNPLSRNTPRHHQQDCARTHNYEEDECTVVTHVMRSKAPLRENHTSMRRMKQGKSARRQLFSVEPPLQYTAVTVECHNSSFP